MKNQKGFIQIPLLVIVIASIIVASVGAGVVLHKQGKLASITANISQMFKEAEETITTEKEEAKSEEEGQEEINQSGLESKFQETEAVERIIPKKTGEEVIDEEPQPEEILKEPREEKETVEEIGIVIEEEEKTEEVSKTKYATVVKLTDSKGNVQLQSEYNGKNTTWLSPWPELKVGETITIRIEVNNTVAEPVLYEFIGTGFPNTWQTENQVTVTIDNDIFNLETIHLRVFVKNSDNRYRAPYYDDMIQVFYKKEMIMGTEVKGIIASDTTWTLENSPYIAVDNITITPDSTLTIEPGVVVKFNTGIHLQVGGVCEQWAL